MYLYLSINYKECPKMNYENNKAHIFLVFLLIKIFKNKLVS